jgi:hypothetical protein
VDDDAAPGLKGAELGDDDAASVDAASVDAESVDAESVDAESVEESVDDELLVGSASAIPGLLAIATSIPNATANAATRPICLA